jgi:hypothetical protein
VDVRLLVFPENIEPLDPSKGPRVVSAGSTTSREHTYIGRVTTISDSDEARPKIRLDVGYGTVRFRIGGDTPTSLREGTLLKVRANRSDVWAVGEGQGTQSQVRPLRPPMH